MSTVDDVCELLETYGGRDKVVRLACYVFKLAGSVKKDEGLLRASSRLSATRTALRLFDDLPILRYNLKYGLGSHETEWSSSVLGVLGNLVDQVFLPVEKVVWLNDMGVIALRPEVASRAETLSTLLWIASLYIALMKSLKQLRHISNQKQCLKLATEGQEAENLVSVKYTLELVTSSKLCLDLVHAASCLPSGMLWGGSLTGTQVGVIATISSLTGIGLHFAKKKYLK